MVALMVQQREATQCRSITPTVGTISSEIPQNNSPYPYIAETIAAFAPGMLRISGFSLSSSGMEEVMSVKGPPKMSPQVRMRMMTEVSLGQRCTSSRKTKRMADASREAMKMVLLKVGLKQDPSSPPKKVLTAHRTAMMRDSRFMPIIDRQKISHVTTTAFTDFTKRKLRMYPGTLGNVHTVMKFMERWVGRDLEDCMFSLLKGGWSYSTNAPATFSMGDSGGTTSTSESSGSIFLLRQQIPTSMREMTSRKNPGLKCPSSTSKQLTIRAIKSPNCELPVHREKASPF